jgi:hypothetical protein
MLEEPVCLHGAKTVVLEVGDKEQSNAVLDKRIVCVGRSAGTAMPTKGTS